MAIMGSGTIVSRRQLRKRLAVIGGGPKAVAIACKAWMIANHGGPLIEVSIFDPAGIGNAWRGGTAGYTDGDQRLCTLIERDLGFPYSGRFLRPGWREAVTVHMRKERSWYSYLESKGPEELSTWVDEGRLSPTHREFAEYLQWAFQFHGARPPVLKQYKVVRLRDNGARQWELHVEGGAIRPELYDGVVLTGSGPVRQVPGHVGAGAGRLFNGQDFWSRLDEVHRLIERMEQKVAREDMDPIVVVGAGGTAAAILAWMIEHGARDLPITVISKSQAALHLRSENPFENRMFNSDVWAKLDPRTRRTFTERLTRGVVWGSVLDRVARATQISFVEGQATGVSVLPYGALKIDYRCFDSLNVPPVGKPTVVEDSDFEHASILVDASGFDGMDWVRLFDPVVTVPVGRDPAREFKEDLELRIKDDLQLSGPFWDGKAPVHVPLLSCMVGPGYASLMSLGDMADRILRHYGG